MSSLIHDDFLLTTPVARRLYHEHAAALPIVDYHCHLDPAALAEDRRFEDLQQLWVAADPYKHRAMRIAGVPERLITGDASPREKFNAWAAVVPQTIGNPLHHWTALELARFFDIHKPLSPATADAVWEAGNKCLVDNGLTARRLLDRCGVRGVCTSDKLGDDLSHHATLRESQWPVTVLPSLRADGLLQDVKADSFAEFLAEVDRRLDAFAALGCRLSDHALDDWCYISTSDDEAERLFARHATGETLAGTDATRLESAVLRAMGERYGRRGWVMQLHIGAQRRTSSRLRREAGPAGGYAGIGQATHIPSLCAFLDDLESADALPRSILYPLNPVDNVPLATLAGSFPGDGVRGNVQLGPAWWYNDHLAGIRRHLEDLSAHGLLACFVGMTTDSRSLLSMTRHEYFRRALCAWIGEGVSTGRLPNDETELAALVRAVCFSNAAKWFLE